MSRYRQLKGIAFNLGDSFCSATNHHYLYELGHYAPDSVSIDLLAGEVVPVKYNTSNAKKAVDWYAKWFKSEIKKSGIDIKEIEKVMIKLSFRKGKLCMNYICSILIKAKGREYKAEIKSGWGMW